MAVHFMKAFQTIQGSVTFYFNRVQTADGVRYHISTVVRNNKAVIFHMAPKANKWVMVDRENLEWLFELEEDLSDTIAKNIVMSRKSKN